MKVSFCKDTAWLLSDEAYLLYSPCMYQASFEEYKERMDCFVADPYVKIFVCELNGKKAGMLVLHEGSTVPEIIGIAVSKNQRHQGIGKQMIQKVMESEKLERIKAQTDDDAIGFYRSLGFNTEKVMKKYPDGISVRYNCSMTR